MYKAWYTLGTTSPRYNKHTIEIDDWDWKYVKFTKLWL